MKSCCNCKNYEKKGKVKNNKYNIPWKTIINAIAVLVFLVFLFVEIFYLKKIEVDDCRPINCHVKTFYDNFCFKVEDKFYVNNIISILCPVVATILGISVDLYSDLIYGVSYSIFRSFSSTNRFSLEEMILIPIIILAICVILYYFCMFVTTCVLNIIVLLYTIYFLFTELRLMTKNEFQRTRILRLVYASYVSSSDRAKEKKDVISIAFGVKTPDSKKDKKKSNKHYSANRQNATIILTTLIYENDFETAFDRLNLKNIEDANNLLELSTNHLIDSQVLEHDKPDEYSTIKRRHIYNVKSYLMKLFDMDINSGSEIKVEVLVKSINAIQQFCSENELLGTFSEDLYMISCLLCPNKNYLSRENKLDKYLLYTSNRILISSLNNHSLWRYKNLFELFRPNNLDSSTRDDKYFIFASIYLFYCSCRHFDDDDFKNDILSLLKKEDGTNRMNSPVFRAIWKFYGCDFDTYVSLLKAILSYFKEIDYVYAWLGTFGSKEGEEIFDSNYLIYWWVAFLFLGACRIPSDFLGKLSDVLDDKEINILALAMKQYTSDDKTLFDEVTKYFEYINLVSKGKNSNDYVNSFIMPTVQSFVDKETSKEKIESRLCVFDSFAPSETYINNLKHVIESSPFYSSNVNLDDAKDWECSGIYDLTRITNYGLRFDEEISYLLLQEFINESHSDTSHQFDFNFIKRTIYKFNNPNCISNEAIYIDDEGKEQKFNKNSISFNMEISSDSGYRNLTADEIDKRINEKYSQKDGLYTYNVPSNTSASQEVLYTTREKLVELIRAEYKQFDLKIKYKVEFKFDEMFTPINGVETPNINENDILNQDDSTSASRAEEKTSTKEAETNTASETAKKEGTSSKKK